MPAGYTASALLGIYTTDALGNLPTFYQEDRTVWVKVFTFLTGLNARSLTRFNVPVPLAARSWRPEPYLTTATGAAMVVSPTNNTDNPPVDPGHCSLWHPGNSYGTGISGTFVPLITPQVAYYETQAGTWSLQMNGYTF
jgi:hypothetical protein